MCQLLGVSTTSYYRWAKPVGRKDSVKVAHRDRNYPNRISSGDRAGIISKLSDPNQAHLSIATLFHSALDKGQYYGSLSTWYRVMREFKPARTSAVSKGHERVVSQRPRPQLCAEKPHDVWCWDITKVRALNYSKGYYVYVLMDLFSRKIVGLRVELCESGELAAQMVEDAIVNEDAVPKVLHSDNGGPMISRALRKVACDYSIEQSFSRPHVSNDNPYSESLFKSLKTARNYPQKFTDIEHARQWVQDWAEQYNTSHYHANLAGLTPQQISSGQALRIIKQREKTIQAYYAQRPQQHRKTTTLPTPQTITWINPPNDEKNTKLTQPA